MTARVAFFEWIIVSSDLELAECSIRKLQRDAEEHLELVGCHLLPLQKNLLLEVERSFVCLVWVVLLAKYFGKLLFKNLLEVKGLQPEMVLVNKLANAFLFLAAALSVV